MNFIDSKTVKVGEAEILNFLPQRGIDSARMEIIDGLRSPQKTISPKYFYDSKGSELFEEITRLNEYYPTRCEKEILSSIVALLDLDLLKLDIFELGSGDASKIRSIFRQIPPSVLSSINYYPVDISQTAIQKSVADILEEFDLNSITGIVADFLHYFDYLPRRNKRLFCFLGSTIGNLTPEEVQVFMKQMGGIMKDGDGLLLGVDMVKDTAILEAAYNDQKGITSAFNLNILDVINTLIQSDFNTSDFDHLAFYNKEKQRIEMHLVARRDLQVKIQATGELIQLAKGERIHTENSHKFSLGQLRELGSYGSLHVKDQFSDSKGWFSLVHYEK